MIQSILAKNVNLLKVSARDNGVFTELLDVYKRQLLYLSGIKDDLVGLRYRSKFVIQIIAASLMEAVNEDGG